MDYYIWEGFFVKKDIVSAIVSVLIVGTSTVFGLILSDRAENTDYSYTAGKEMIDNFVNSEIPDITSDTVTVSERVVYTLTDTAAVSEKVTQATQVTASLTVSLSAATSEAAASSEITTAAVSETKAEESSVTEAPASKNQEQPPQSQEQPQEPQNNPEPVPAPVNPEPEPSQDPEPEFVPSVPDSATEFQRELLHLVNEERAARGVSALVCTEKFNEGAQIRAEELIELFDHVRPGKREWYTIYSDVGISAGYMGENIAAGSGTPEDVFKQWRESPQHYENMINPNYRTIGIGYAYSDEGFNHYWVQLFG